ncbi:MAG TPA: alanine racemase [Rhizomicrobium sp.]|jgi:alanine racemase|nr:alanine racemase [Rhizomicrobium sp.]
MSNPDFEAARLTVRLDAVAANYRVCQRLAGPAAVAGVVKADGYGLGAVPVARALAGAGCDTFFVARLEEGVSLRKAVPHARIFVLDGAAPDTVPALIESRLTPVLNSLAEIAGWSAAARSTGAELEAAIHIDTGMNRLGLPGDELSLLASEAGKRLAGLRVVLWLSHLACADDPAARMNAVQLDRFRTALAMLPPAPASFASSGGVLLGKDYAFDMVRPGIGLYGGNVQNAPQNPFAVAAVLTARVLQIRRIDRGDSVGYGASFRARRPTLIATVAAGYADGLMRAIGNRGAAAIAGKRVPIVGRVSMDLVTLDVTDIPPASLSTDTDVEFFGDTISLEAMAEAAGTAAYEILTSLTPRVPRRYEGAGP